MDTPFVRFAVSANANRRINQVLPGGVPMTQEPELTSFRQKPKRPMGIWFSTIFGMLLGGIAPLALAVYTLVVDGSAGREWYTLTVIVIGIFVTLTGVGVWLRKPPARLGFLIAMILFFLFMIAGLLTEIISRDITQADLPGWWLDMLQYVLLIALYIWYFNRPSTRQYFTS